MKVSNKARQAVVAAGIVGACTGVFGQSIAHADTIAGVGTGQRSTQTDTAGTRYFGNGPVRPLVGAKNQFAPAMGGVAYNESRQSGSNAYADALRRYGSEGNTVTAYSQSSDALQRLARKNPGLVKGAVLVFQADPGEHTSNHSGIAAQNPAFNTLGITSSGPSAYHPTAKQVVYVCRQYDGVCDWNQSDLLHIANSIAGYFTEHPKDGPGVTKAELDRAIVTRNGNEVHYFIPTRVAPITKVTNGLIRMPADPRFAHRAQARKTTPAAPRHNAAADVSVNTGSQQSTTSTPQSNGGYSVTMPMSRAQAPTPVTQTQVSQAAAQVTRAVPQAAPVVKQVLSNPVVKNFLAGLSR